MRRALYVLLLCAGILILLVSAASILVIHIQTVALLAVGLLGYNTFQTARSELEKEDK